MIEGVINSKDEALTALIYLEYLGYDARRKRHLFLIMKSVRLFMQQFRQIKDNRYADKIILVGINYDKKTKKHDCKIGVYVGGKR